MTDDDLTPTERLEQERNKPIDEQPGPVTTAPDPRPMHNDSDLARRLTLVLDRDEIDTGRDEVILAEHFTDPDAPRRFSVRVKDHDHGGEYHLSPTVTAAELSAWINGLETGYRGVVDEKTDSASAAGDDEGAST